MMHGAGVAVAKSIASKIVLNNELGQLNSVMAVSENVIVLGIYPLYNYVYRQTFQTFAGSFFLLSAVMGVIPLVLFIYVFLVEPAEFVEKEPKKSPPSGISIIGDSLKIDSTQQNATPEKQV
ncbi:hypothetical protein LSTR_LSTR010653 [Laodelphax striatellus]|uniref:Major facilitator superfamily (MFS) profile domain-containing protein n=1 Tax=Laodelphax striatellus TaxID=195883 RepID=A0A482XPJ1_LAOST|nr:hypothetical protein LSTR_LSTR010653 [Laodelphax striatellus]